MKEKLGKKKDENRSLKLMEVANSEPSPICGESILGICDIFSMHY